MWCGFVVNICVLVSQAIADMVTEENLAEGRLYPPLSTIREVSFKIAVKVGDPPLQTHFGFLANIALVL